MKGMTVPYIWLIIPGVIKKRPIMEPAKAPESTDRAIKLIILTFRLPKQVLYPTILVVKSKRTLAARKAKNCMAVGRRMKLIIVAMRPTAVAAPNFLVHHTAMMRQVKPIRSQTKGRWVTVQKMGEIIELSTPHRAADIEIATISRLVK
jgi:hypothetical protein